MSQLVAEQLAKSYQGRSVVKAVSLRVQRGEIVGLLGPNGAGKTTTFYMVAGIVRCDSGQIFLNGRAISGLPLHARARLGLGYLPQEASVFRRLSVIDNVMAVLELCCDNLGHAARLEKAEALLEIFQLSRLRDQLGQVLSGGERRRVEIARAMAANPQFILLDEPFAGVDPISVIELKGIMQQLRQQGLGILITDHNVRETLTVCEHAYIVSQGEVLAQGTPMEILQDPAVQQVYLGEGFRL